MAIKYSVEQMKVGFGEKKTSAYVGRIQLGDTISTEKLEEQVSLRTMLPRNVVHTVLGNIVDSVIHFVEEGQGVRLGELGIFKPAITTRAATADSDVEVSGIRLRYIQSKKMYQAIHNLSVRKLSETTATDTDNTTDDDTTDNGSTSSGNTPSTGEDNNPL